jgi:formamidopyrimidine-DNA glycosylase
MISIEGHYRTNTIVAPLPVTLKPQTDESVESSMPELPEVQTVVNTLAPALTGKRIVRIVHLRPDIVTPIGLDLPKHLQGRRIKSIHRRAKRIVFTLDDNNAFYIHLGMSGRLTLDVPDSPIPPHTHFILEIAPLQRGMGVSPMHLRFKDARRFGGIFWLGCESCEENIGPEPLTLRPTEFAKRLARTKRAIKNALLDQRLIAGLGNIYVDESLHAAKIHPLTRADKLKPDQITRLTKSIKQVLTKALKHRGSSLRDYVDAQGARGGFQRLHKVYDREGQPCSACKTAIKRIVLGGRSTCFCPTCQPGPRIPRKFLPR